MVPFVKFSPGHVCFTIVCISQPIYNQYCTAAEVQLAIKIHIECGPCKNTPLAYIIHQSREGFCFLLFLLFARRILS